MVSEESKKNDEQDLDSRYKTLRRKARLAEEKVMQKNIYKRGVFETLTEVSGEIQRIARATHKDFHKVLQETGIKDPDEIFDESVSHWDSMLRASSIPSEEQLIESLQDDFQLKLTKAADVFLPTDRLEPHHGDRQESKEPGDDVNRVGLAIETILHMRLDDEKILLDDLKVTVGRVPEHSWRTRPYWVIDLKKYKIAVFLNNQHSNRTFVLGYKTKKNLGELEKYTKEHLKALSERPKSLIHHFVFHDDGQFRGELAATIQKVYEGKAMAKPYATYEEAQRAVHALGITSQKDYMKRYREDPRLHSNPVYHYKEDFVGWADFLGTGNKSTRERSAELYATYEEASAAARALGIKTKEEYAKRYREDPKLTSSPNGKYGKDFKGWKDFLGTLDKRRHSTTYPTYEQAREAARALGSTSGSDYNQRRHENPRLPASPLGKYGKAFVGWADFLGTGNKSYIERHSEFYVTYEEAKKAAQALGAKSQTEYYQLYKKDPRLSSNPDRTYKKTFLSWGDFLGTETKNSMERSRELYSTYEEAKKAAQKLRIKSETDYRMEYKKDPRLPSSPSSKYGDEFVSWADFLGKKKK